VVGISGTCLHQLGRHADPEVSRSGKRSLVAKRGRPSTTMVRKPRVRPSVTRGIATVLAPTTTSVDGGVNTSAEGGTFSRNSVRDLPASMASRASVAKTLIEEGVAERALLPAVSKSRSLAPLCGASRRVTITARRPARVDAGALVVGQRGVVLVVERHRLQKDLDGAAAGEADLPRLLVAQVQLEEPRGVLVQHVGRLLDDLRVHAAPIGHRAEHAPPSPTSIFAPSFRGVVPRVLTRVATVTLDSFRLSWFSCSESSSCRLPQV